LNKDYYEGNLKIWADSMNFLSGKYTMHIKNKEIVK